MPALVALIGALTVLNLLLTFGVIRRLREHTQQLAQGGGGRPTLPVDERVAAFDGTTTDGEPVGRELLDDNTLVGFLTPGCEPCRKRVPELVETARAWPGGRYRTAIVVVGSDDDAQEYVQRLAPVAKVVVEAPGGPIATAFGVRAYPVFGVVDATGRVLRSEMEPAALRTGPVPAAA